MNKKISVVNFLLVFSFIIALLYYGKFILLPLSLAIFFFIIIKSLSNKLLSQIKLIFNINLNEIIALITMVIIISSFFYSFWIILKLNIYEVRENSIQYQKNFEQIIQLFSETPLDQFIPKENFLNSFNLISLFSKIINSFTAFAGNFSLIIVFLIFLLVEEKYFLKKIELTISRTKLNLLKKINNDIFNYFELKTFTSFLSGVLTFLILYLLKNDLAPSFGILAFILNFIPLIGSLLSVLIPFIFSIIQFLGISEPILTLIFLFIVQIFVGNFVEPKLMGKKLNISPIVMLIFLSLMGKLWGITGMFLCVPLLVVLLIVLRNIKATKKIAFLLSEKGNY